MSIYISAAPDGVEWVVPANKTSRHILRDSTHGTPVADRWTAPQVRLLRVDEHGNALARSDAPIYSARAPVLRTAGVEVFEPFLADCEVLPLETQDGEELWIVNVLRVLSGALDVESTQFRRIPTGKVIDIPKPVFQFDAVRDVPIFKVAEHPSGNVYFAHDLVREVQSSHLLNVAFQKVWQCRQNEDLTDRTV